MEGVSVLIFYGEGDESREPTQCGACTRILNPTTRSNDFSRMARVTATTRLLKRCLVGDTGWKWQIKELCTLIRGMPKARVLCEPQNMTAMRSRSESFVGGRAMPSTGHTRRGGCSRVSNKSRLSATERQYVGSPSWEKRPHRRGPTSDDAKLTWLLCYNVNNQVSVYLHEGQARERVQRRDTQKVNYG